MNLQSFIFDKTKAIRTTVHNGMPHFVAADVCAALDLDNTSRACGRLDSDERGITTSDTPSGDQQMLVITESGVWSLVLTSRKPQAKAFKKWLTSEVIPALYRTGRYTAPEQIEPMDARLSTALLALLMHVPGWDDVMRYREMGLSQEQIGILTHKSQKVISRMLRQMAAAGLSVPASTRRFGDNNISRPHRPTASSLALSIMSSASSSVH